MDAQTRARILQGFCLKLMAMLSLGVCREVLVKMSSDEVEALKGQV